MSLHPAVKVVPVIIITVIYGGAAVGPPAAFVALKNPMEECEALLKEIKTFINGTPVFQIHNFLFLTECTS